MTSTLECDCTHDAFLGGLLHLWQPRRGYRAGVDPVLLAASVSASAGQTVLDIGCGVGAAALCLGARVPGLVLSGVEREPLYADCARRNGLDVTQADVAALPLDLRQRQFDHVLTNPPFFDRAASVEGPDAAREAARGEGLALTDWITVASKRVKPKGHLHIIHQMSRLPEILRALPSDMGTIEVLPLAARVARDPERMILRARRGGRTPFRMCSPLILHLGCTHERDGEDYAPAVRAVLRAGAPLTF